jgi:hypothetical protein
MEGPTALSVRARPAKAVSRFDVRSNGSWGPHPRDRRTGVRDDAGRPPRLPLRQGRGDLRRIAVGSVCFGPVLLGRFDERELRIHGAHNSDKLYRSAEEPVFPMLPVYSVTYAPGLYRRSPDESLQPTSELRMPASLAVAALARIAYAPLRASATAALS